MTWMSNATDVDSSSQNIFTSTTLGVSATNTSMASTKIRIDSVATSKYDYITSTNPQTAFTSTNARSTTIPLISISSRLTSREGGNTWYSMKITSPTSLSTLTNSNKSSVKSSPRYTASTQRITYLPFTTREFSKITGNCYMIFYLCGFQAFCAPWTTMNQSNKCM